jgi:aryl-alcohol dehydrogenase-like predicted oxidoreductase
MRYRTVPRTGRRLSEVTFGAGTAAGLMVRGDPAEQRAVVERALDLGITSFDTSPVYGLGCSEVNLGNALRGHDDAVVTTKVALTPEHLLTGSVGHCIRRSVEASRQRLRRDHIDVLLVHNSARFRRAQPLTARHEGPYGQSQDLPHVTLDELLGEGGAWETVAELIADGTVGSFGISGWDTDPDVLRALIGARVLDVANLPLNLLNPTAFRGARGTGFLADVEDDFVDFDHVSGFAADNGCALAVISPVAAGVLTADAQTGRTPPAVSQWRTRFPAAGLHERELGRASAFVPLAERAGMTLTELAYRFTLSVPAVVTVLGGFSSAAQVEEVARAVEQGPLPADVLAELDRVWLGGQ